MTRVGSSGRRYAVGRSGRSEYEFNALPRRIHGVWKGISLGECVGGNCQSLPALTPERWATIALRDSQIYHLERSGSYLGFVQYVPLQNNGQTYASVDFGAPILANRIGMRGSDGSLQTRPFFELMLERAEQNRLAEWAGFVVGQSEAINNAGVVSEVHRFGAYVFGQQLPAPAREFQHLDSMAAALTNVIPRASHASGYGGNMIADALVPDAGTLTLLNTPHYVLEANWRANLEEFKSFLNGLPPEQLASWLRYIDSKPQHDRLRINFLEFFKIRENQIRLLSGIRNLSPSDRMGVFALFDKFGGDRRLLATMASRVARDSATAFAEKLAILQWMEKDDELRQSLERFLRVSDNQRNLLDRILQVHPEYRSALLTLVGQLGGDQQQIRIAGMRVALDHATPLQDRIAILIKMEEERSLAQEPSNIGRLRDYFIELRVTGEQLPSSRADFLAGLASPSEEWTRFTYLALTIAPDELLPTAEEFARLPKRAQAKLINVLRTLDPQPPRSEALLRLAFSSSDAEVRILAQTARPEGSVVIPSLAEIAQADGDLARMVYLRNQ